ncbi:hypothetical protein AWRI1631_112040 [Saccharomyces cerevisiae AWRI1631]|uniref:Uncharacterized protein n=1 Tax=Saccharomyces cerevisiae (strain AWRI1631) TaxID=545124 RepID=B5VMD4_YEAS6|nr:hypothetical protein AWRI1631_112040 [Saccharomyces cerevisiae AWRI1631]
MLFLLSLSLLLLLQLLSSIQFVEMTKFLLLEGRGNSDGKFKSLCGDEKDLVSFVIGETWALLVLVGVVVLLAFFLSMIIMGSVIVFAKISPLWSLRRNKTTNPLVALWCLQ